MHRKLKNSIILNFYSIFIFILFCSFDIALEIDKRFSRRLIEQAIFLLQQEDENALRFVYKKKRNYINN